MATEHKCAAVGCQKQVEQAMLMCGPHWRMVPEEIRQRVWTHIRAKRHGVVGADDEHHRACADAIKAVRRVEIGG